MPYSDKYQLIEIGFIKRYFAVATRCRRGERPRTMLLLRLPPPLGVRGAAWLRGCDAVEFGGRTIPIVRAMHLHENAAGRLFYLDAARALCLRGAVTHDDMTLYSIEQGV